ncbi:hypothetical protein EDC45_0364 [Mesocricetibacter intestinalis]|uniref:Transferrin binding protein n=1 Tax=Mesocricetibacter intestinalis TaxID=1521930 RepID=A0A4R6VCX5_9PAST|nr:hypothetical protein [Mesocricetibacter intestinalis]TDQ59706.1 hypothetical protein EDC45_0364 [Mesocricetibacter intestinalis]
MKDYKKLFSALCLSACLAACSGGGGGNNTPQNPPRGNQPPQQTPPQGQQPQQPQQPDKGQQPPQPQRPDSGPQLPQPPQQNPEAPPPAKPEIPPQNQPEPAPKQPDTPRETGYSVLKVNHTGSYTAKLPVTKNKVPVYDIVKGSKNSLGEDILEQEEITVAVPAKAENGNYELKSIDKNNESEAFFGYFREITPDSKNLFVNYIYGFERSLENKNVPENLTAKYYKENGFMYSLRRLNQQGGSLDNVVNTATVNIEFQNGKISKGHIYQSGGASDLFTIEKGATVNQLVLTPTEHLGSGNLQGDKAVLEGHFVDSAKDKKDYRYLVGSVKAENWYGVLAAEKQ